MNYVASQYALAVFSLACEQNLELSFKTAWDQTLAGFDDEVMKFFKHPNISKSEKKAVVEKTVADNLVKNLLFVLIDNRRLELLHAISEEYLTLLNNRQKTMDVIIYSKQPMSPSHIDQLAISMGKQHKRLVKIDNRIDASIIAGIRIEYEGYVIDETVNRQLNDMKMHLKK